MNFYLFFNYFQQLIGYKSLLILLTLTLLKTDAAPARHKNPKHPAAIMTQGKPTTKGPKKIFWWSNPCAVPGGEEREIPLEEINKAHLNSGITDSDIPKKWLIQLRIAIDHLTRIDKLYEVVKPHFSADSFNHTWLPEQPFHWLEKWQKKQPVISPIRAITELYKGLQKFAVTIDCIMRQPGCKVKGQKPLRKNKHKSGQRTLESAVYAEARKGFFNELKNELRKLLCEVQVLLIHLQIAKLPAPPTPTIIRIEGWVPNPDESQARLQDWGVLSQYIRYLKQWEHIAIQIERQMQPFRSEKPRRTKQGKNPNKTREGRQRPNNRKIKKIRH